MGRGRTGDRVYERQNSDFILEAEESCWVLSTRQKQSHCDGQMQADLKGPGVSSLSSKKGEQLVSRIQAAVTDTGRKG